MAAYRNIDDWPQLSRPVATPTGAAGLLGSFGSGTTLPLISAIQSNFEEIHSFQLLISNLR